MTENIYYRFGKPYRKLKRNEIIEKGAMHSFCGGELMPITNSDGQTIGRLGDEQQSSETKSRV